MNGGEAMDMRIMNNTSAMLSLGETNKNQKALDKQLKKVATGQKIIGAGDGASGICDFGEDAGHDSVFKPG